MRINEIDKLIQYMQGQQPMTSARKLVQEFEQTCARINREKALQAAESQLQQDQLLCEVMQAWTLLAKMTGPKLLCMKVPAEAKQALIIAKHALETASEELARVQHPVQIRRVP